VSAAIRTSLNKLNNAVHKLESAIETRKAAIAAAPKKAAAGAAGQNDLFSAVTASQQPTNMNPMNVRMLAKRLDNAIEQVETILKEGRG
jgi:hypothetical protein